MFSWMALLAGSSAARACLVGSVLFSRCTSVPRSRALDWNRLGRTGWLLEGRGLSVDGYRFDPGGERHDTPARADGSADRPQHALPAVRRRSGRGRPTGWSSTASEVADGAVGGFDGTVDESVGGLVGAGDGDAADRGSHDVGGRGPLRPASRARACPHSGCTSPRLARSTKTNTRRPAAPPLREGRSR